MANFVFQDQRRILPNLFFFYTLFGGGICGHFGFLGSLKVNIVVGVAMLHGF
jgi:lipid-A-disaccharide synthase-like uncharacterized protein